MFQPFKQSCFVLTAIYTRKSGNFTPKNFNLVKLRIDEQMRLLMVSEKVAVVSQEMSSRNHRCPGIVSSLLVVLVCVLPSKKIGVDVDTLRRILYEFYSTSSDKKKQPSHMSNFNWGRNNKKHKDFPTNGPGWKNQNRMHHRNSSSPQAYYTDTPHTLTQGEKSDFRKPLEKVVFL